MNSDQAKEILMLFRPGTADADDPEFAEALAFVKTDPELGRWFDEHCAVQSVIRTKFRQIPVPEGLKEQILSERKSHFASLWKRPAAIATVVGLLALAGVLAALLTQRAPTLAEFQAEMTTTALSAYIMDLETTDPQQIRDFLSNRRVVAEYNVPESLRQRATPVGCMALNWEDTPVSMICFRSERPLKAGAKSDLYLFVTERSALAEDPAQTGTTVQNLNGAATATWTEGDKTYFLVADGDEEFLRSFL